MNDSGQRFADGASGRRVAEFGRLLGGQRAVERQVVFEGHNIQYGAIQPHFALNSPERKAMFGGGHLHRHGEASGVGGFQQVMRAEAQPSATFFEWYVRNGTDRAIAKGGLIGNSEAGGTNHGECGLPR